MSMPLQRPSLRQLEYFVALSEHLNFRAAATACFVTQPALSGQIAQMESLLGVKLFERDKRQVRLTPEGERLLPVARDVLAKTTELVDVAESFGAPLTGRLRLGAIPTVGPYLLPRVLPAVREAFPALRLYLREDLTPNLLEQLQDGELDLLLLDIDVDLGDAVTHPLFSDPFLVAVREDDPLAGRAEVTIGDLAQREILLLQEGHCLRDQTLPLCERAGGEEVPGFRGSSLSTIVQMVAGGLGITLVPELAVEREIGSTPGLRTASFGAEGPCRTIGLAWRRTSAHGDEYRALGETLVRAYLAS